MNALFLKDLAAKTRRGLRGRVEAGKSGGGNAFGYDVVRAIDRDGELLRGERAINDAQAATVRRIFAEYAEGIAPRAIAKALNAEGVASPAGRGWGPSTIHGHRQRGTGILNNELYVGRLIWNRLHYAKDPDSGKRVSRLNPEREWIVQDVPDLRIISQELWDKAKARQRSLDAGPGGKQVTGYWDRRRPRFLLTGLMKCGRCGGGFVNFNKVYVGCANARNKGTCDNKATIRRANLEAAILDGLQNRLMDERLVKLFCEDYARQLNRLIGEAGAQREADRATVAKIERELDRLVHALMDGIPASRVKAKMEELDARKEALSDRLADHKETMPRMHPTMASHYRRKIADLSASLTGEDRSNEAVEIVRSLIDRIVLAPSAEKGRKGLTITMEGQIASILAMAANTKGPLDASDACLRVTKLVAGAGFEPATFRL